MLMSYSAGKDEIPWVVCPLGGFGFHGCSETQCVIRVTREDGPPLVRDTASWTSLGGSGDRSIGEARSLPHGSRLMPPC